MLQNIIASINSNAEKLGKSTLTVNGLEWSAKIVSPDYVELSYGPFSLHLSHHSETGLTDIHQRIGSNLTKVTVCATRNKLVRDLSGLSGQVKRLISDAVKAGRVTFEVQE